MTIRLFRTSAVRAAARHTRYGPQVSIAPLVHELRDAVVEVPLVDTKRTTPDHKEVSALVLVGPHALRFIRKHVSIRKVIAFSEASAAGFGHLEHRRRVGDVGTTCSGDTRSTVVFPCTCAENERQTNHSESGISESGHCDLTPALTCSRRAGSMSLLLRRPNEDPSGRRLVETRIWDSAKALARCDETEDNDPAARHVAGLKIVARTWPAVCSNLAADSYGQPCSPSGPPFAGGRASKAYGPRSRPARRARPYRPFAPCQ
jgi:hypothetical protein